MSYSVQQSFSNDAFNGKTEQYNFDISSQLVVDGDLSTWSVLGPASGPWWKVDLGREGLVTGVRLALRVENHGNDTGILLIKTVRETGGMKQCTTVGESVIAGNGVAHVVRSCSEPLLGRYVKVKMVANGGCRTALCQFTMLLYEMEVKLGKEIS